MEFKSTSHLVCNTEFKSYCCAYGNSPPFDYLQNCTHEKEPSLLVLGCGDIQSCFYSLWKNFDTTGQSNLFNGVHFFLNDASAAVLARNVLFLYLCLHMPEDDETIGKWLSGMWAIWCCHELYSEHNEMMKDALCKLCEYSDAWSSDSNPLYPIINFSTPGTLQKVQKIWQVWAKQDTNTASVKEMLSSCLTSHDEEFDLDTYASKIVASILKVPFEKCLDSSSFQAQSLELVSYFKTGSIYAESVIGLNLSDSKTSVNSTLYAGENGTHKLDHKATPFNCFFQTCEFSGKGLKNLKLSCPTCLLVDDNCFTSLPFLANSVQQYFIWLMSSHKILKSNKHNIKFTLDCSHALTLCYRLESQQGQCRFDVIYSSNLINSLSMPDLILSASPLLKHGGFLFASSQNKFVSLKEYLIDSFGFEYKLFPILLGIRCINHEGKGYASPVTILPCPFTIHEKLIVCEKADSNRMPLFFATNQRLSGILAQALFSFMEISLLSRLKSPKIPVSNMSMETAIKIILTFMSNSCADFDPLFWEPLSDLLRKNMQPFLNCLQIQLFLHGVHMHVTVTKPTCPICLDAPLCNEIGLFCTDMPSSIDFDMSSSTDFQRPNFLAVVHKEDCEEPKYLFELAIAGGNVHLFDCFTPIDCNAIYFYSLLKLLSEEYKVTVVTSTTSIGLEMSWHSISHQLLKKLLISYNSFSFTQPSIPSIKWTRLESFGKVSSHLSDGNTSELDIDCLEGISSDQIQLAKLSSKEIQVSYGNFPSCCLKFPYPIKYEDIQIRHSETRNKLSITCSHAPQQFFEERVLFIVNPDKLLQCEITENAMMSFISQQFTQDEYVSWESSKDQTSPLLRIKEVLSHFFYDRNKSYYCIIIDRKVHGLVIINNRLFNYENRTPVIDLAFYFLEGPFTNIVISAWNTISPKPVHNVVVDCTQFELLKKVFCYFASRTYGSCTTISNSDLMHQLMKCGAYRYFTRTALPLLLCDPDHRSQASWDVLSISQALEIQVKNEKCGNCGHLFEITLECVECKKVKYCSKQCLDEHWKSHKAECREKSPLFPLSRYWYYDDFKFYYAYGNTPAEDFLQNCTGIKKPSILSLGCGDIRSYFYTFWKNFDFSISSAPRKFHGVHFVLNDCSSSVLARNILFLYLCYQLPKDKDKKKKWLCAMWAIWYCHELYPQHQRIFDSSLKSLLKYSGSLKLWGSETNPLKDLVKFTSSVTLAKISQVWVMWLERNLMVKSVEEMHSSRLAELRAHGEMFNLEQEAKSFARYSTVIFSDDMKIVTSTAKFDAQVTEAKNYKLYGNCYAENVLDEVLPSDSTSVNLTLYERPDGVYTLHYGSLPYKGYYHTVEFCPDSLDLAGTSKGLCDSMLVQSKSFIQYPFLANSVQQFSMWVQSSNKTFHDKNASVSFTFNNQHALSFCCELQSSDRDTLNCNGNQFDLIYTSNLIDHLSPANVVLSTRPLLKPDGLLFTNTLLYKRFSKTVEEYLQLCFGFDCKFLPVILGIRCINHEGIDYSSPVMIEPTPMEIGHISVQVQQQPRLLIWKKVASQPFIFSQLPLLKPAQNVTNALFNSMQSLVYTLLAESSSGLPVLNNNCIETAMLVLETFMSFIDVSASNCYQFWEPLSSALSSCTRIKPFLHGLQVQLLLHQLHMHLTVDEKDCPVCNATNLEQQIGLFSADIPVPVPHDLSNFLFIIHHFSSSNMQFLCNEADSGNDVHIIDSIEGSMTNNTLRLRFFAPLKFVAHDYNITLGSSWMSRKKNYFHTILSTRSIRDFQVKFIHFKFTKFDHILSQSESDTCDALGILTSHICDGVGVDFEITLSDPAVVALALNGLHTEKISSSVIQLSCGRYVINLRCVYPIKYDEINIKVIKRCKMIKIFCPRQGYQFEEENSVFISSPDHQLSFSSQKMSESFMISHSGLQMTQKDLQVIKKPAHLKPPLLNVKETLMFFFQCHEEIYFHLKNPHKVFIGMVLVNRCMLDYQHKAPAVDAAFCFLEDHDFSKNINIHDSWFSLLKKFKTIRDIFIDDAEYHKLKKVVLYLAKRTNGTCKSAGKHSKYHVLCRDKVDSCFIRAVVYLLYCDPDHKAITLMSNICNGCNRVCGSPKKCTRCEKVQYCSKECQSKHWLVHSISCVSSYTQEDSSSDVASTVKCTYCGKTVTVVKKCAQCGEVQYCNKECQAKDWPEHKLRCKKNAKCDSAKKLSQVEGVEMSCAYCGTFSQKLLKCGKCRTVEYCGKECQKKHWKTHKNNCNK